MKSTKQMCVVLVVVLIMLGAYQQGRLEADNAASPAKIGIVNVTEVLENCQRHKKWQEDMKIEQAAVMKEVETIKNELDALQANLKLRKRGSDDYLKLLEEMGQKKATYDAKQQFYQTKVEEKMRNWTEQLYKELLTVTGDLAKRKGFDIVMSNEKLDSADLSMRDFLSILRMKKVLYYNSKYDLTAEAIAAMDSLK